MLSTELQLANTILSVASHAPYIAIGSAFIQVADVVTDSGWRRTVADDTNEDESLEVHLYIIIVTCTCHVHVHGCTPCVQCRFLYDFKGHLSCMTTT